MKQVIVTKPFQYEVIDVPIPEPGAGEVLVQMKAAGVCGSDFHLFLGENPQAIFPRVPGHENAGVVAKIGTGVTKVQEGDHIVVDLVVACGECPQCRSGRPNVCRTVKARGAAIDGGWREYFVVPEHEVHLVPAEISFSDAALVEPFAIGGHCTVRGEVTGKEVVLVLGSGTIGAVILQTCKEKGCKVICADINESSLGRALSYGADHVINTRQENLVERVQEITQGQGVDVIFDSACYPGSLTEVMQSGIITNGGRIVPLGFCMEPEQITQAMINGRELKIIGSRMSCGQFVPTIEKMAAGKLVSAGMVSHYIPFDQIDQVFANMTNSPADLKKMVILFD